MPIAISVNMLRLRVTSDCQPRTKNGAARPQHYGRRERELNPVRRGARLKTCRPSRCWPISSAKIGTVSTRPIQNRRVMSASSGLGPVVGGRDLRFERHAADRAGAGPDLADLRMHRAGVDRRLPARRHAAACQRDTFPGRRRTWCGIRRNRNSRARRDSCGGAASCADRPSCRRPDRARCRRPGRLSGDARATIRSLSGGGLRQIPPGGI